MERKNGKKGRIMHDCNLYKIGAGSSEVRRLVIGRALNSEQKMESNSCTFQSQLRRSICPLLEVDTLHTRMILA